MSYDVCETGHVNQTACILPTPIAVSLCVGIAGRLASLAANQSKQIWTLFVLATRLIVVAVCTLLNEHLPAQLHITHLV